MNQYVRTAPSTFRLLYKTSCVDIVPIKLDYPSKKKTCFETTYSRKVFCTHRIHGTGISTYFYHQNQLNVSTIYQSHWFGIDLHPGNSHGLNPKSRRAIYRSSRGWAMGTWRLRLLCQHAPYHLQFGHGLATSRKVQLMAEIRRENQVGLVVEIPLFTGCLKHLRWLAGSLPSTAATWIWDAMRRGSRGFLTMANGSIVFSLDVFDSIQIVKCWLVMARSKVEPTTKTFIDSTGTSAFLS